jgi:uncharacterized MAPEG superfamily protein
VVLLLVYIALQGQLATAERGLGWNAGARDGEAKPLGKFAGRAERALKNFQETYPAFAALALGLAVSGRSGGLGETGALLWIAARVVYIPLYLFGVPYIRSLAWTASLLGLVLMLVRFL